MKHGDTVVFGGLVFTVIENWDGFYLRCGDEVFPC